ncbi:hypothetical protein QOZ80_6AG0545460 [Eleusine coracana subsp. coracana]|nr:hypothetical protein QOZ80_6AG0545460 [Eleusine coracana subsp. coracana]
MASQPPPGVRMPRTPPPPPPPPSVPPAAGSYERKCIELAEWWLERMDGNICIAGVVETPAPQIRKGGLSSQGNRKPAAVRLFKRAIASVWGSVTVETVDGGLLLLKGILSNSRMRENGFSEEVCELFMYGFPDYWEELLDSKMEHTHEHSQSSSSSDDDALDEKLLVPEKSSFVARKTGNTSQAPAAGMTPPSGAVQASEKNEVTTLRSGKVLGGPVIAPITGGNKRSRSQHKTSNNNKLPNEAVSSTADLTSHENGCSVAVDKPQPHDSHTKGRTKPRKAKSARRESKSLFTNL